MEQLDIVSELLNQYCALHSCVLTLNNNWCVSLCMQPNFTSPTAALVKYCNEHCLSASISPEPHARSLPNFACTLPITVAQSFSGGVTQSQGDRVILGVYFRIQNALYGPYSGMNFTTKYRFGLNLLIYQKV